jgi:hypothetical protein
MKVEWPAGLAAAGLLGPQLSQPSKRGLFSTMRPASWLGRQPGDQQQQDGGSAARRRRRQQQLAQGSDPAAADTGDTDGSRSGSFANGGQGLVSEQMVAATDDGMVRSSTSDVALTRLSTAPVFHGLRVSEQHPGLQHPTVHHAWPASLWQHSYGAFVRHSATLPPEMCCRRCAWAWPPGSCCAARPSARAA